MLARRPLPNGMNLLDRYVNPKDTRELYNEWQFYRTWIRFLHFPGLKQFIGKTPDDRLDARGFFATLYRIGRELLEIEYVMYKTEPHTDNYDSR
jgi:hypothetical protein